MNDKEIIDMMIVFQIIGIVTLYLERDYIKQNWDKIPRRAMMARLTISFLPILVILSLLARPLYD